MSSEMNAQTIRRWVERAWNGGDFSEMESLYAPEYVMHDPSGTVTGAGALAAFIAAYRAGISNLRMTIDGIVACGDDAAWRFTVTGRNDGSLFGMPPTNRDVEVGGIVMTRFTNGRWAEDWVQFDAAGMFRQLGAEQAVPVG